MAMKLTQPTQVLLTSAKESEGKTAAATGSGKVSEVAPAVRALRPSHT